MIEKIYLWIAKMVSFPDNLMDIHDDEENAIIDE
jgi:hypothetical protein